MGKFELIWCFLLISEDGFDQDTTVKVIMATKLGVVAEGLAGFGLHTSQRELEFSSCHWNPPIGIPFLWKSSWQWIFTSGTSYPSEESCWHLRSGLVAPWTFGSQDRVPSSWPTSLGRFDQKNPAKLGGFKKNLVSDEVRRGWSFRPSHPKWTSARTPYDSGDAGCNGPYAPGRVFKYLVNIYRHLLQMAVVVGECR